MKRYAHAPEVNNGPILEVLERVLPPAGTVLEIASGTGQHAAIFAAALPSILWTPSDVDQANVDSIQAWRVEAALPNLRPPLVLDATALDWEVPPVDAVVAINLTHAAPWAATVGLLSGAAQVLVPGGKLILYGPFLRSGTETSPSNAEFDATMRAKNEEWGLRSLDEITLLAEARALDLEEIVERPSHNLMVIFKRRR